MTEIVVTQADREAAIKIFAMIFGNGHSATYALARSDRHFLFDELARHRIAALEEAAKVAIEALTEAREALHFHYVEWDGEPEDAVPLQLARSRCDAAIRALKGPTDEH